MDKLSSLPTDLNKYTRTQRFFSSATAAPWSEGRNGIEPRGSIIWLWALRFDRTLILSYAFIIYIYSRATIYHMLLYYIYSRAIIYHVLL